MPKKEIIQKIQTALSKEIEFVRQEKGKTTEEKMAEIDVLLDTIKFLNNYDENVKVLNKHIRDKQREDR